MPTYKITGPDGIVYRVTGDGSAEDALAQVQAKIGIAAEPAAKEPTKSQPSTAEKIASDPLMRFAIGAAEPIQGLVQRMSENGFGKAFPLLSSAAKMARPLLDESFAETKKMARRGGEETGTDFMGLFGNIASPASLAAGKLGIPASLSGKIGAGAALGGAGGMLAPAETEGEARKNAAIGAAFGGLLPAVIGGGAKAYEGLANSVLRPVGDLFRDDGAMDIAKRYITRSVGENRLPETVNAAREAVKPKSGPGLIDVPGYRQTVAETQTNISGGSPLAALQDAIRSRPGGVSANFGDRATANALALDKAKAAADLAAAPLRNTALTNANLAGVLKPSLDKQALRMAGAAESKVEDVRRFTAASGRAAERAAATTSTPGMPNTPGRYTYMGDLEKKAEQVATKSAADSLPMGEAARFTKMQADSLAQHGYFPLTPTTVENRLTAIMNKPGNKANPTIQNALGEINNTLKRVTSDDGIIDARELYTIRKASAGNAIEKFAKENSSWDKKMTSGLLRDVQRAIDDSIEESGGTGWKDYLREYGGRMKSIESLMERSQEMYKPIQRTAGVGGSDVTGAEVPKFNSFLSREAMLGNMVLRTFGKKIEPKVEAVVADLMLNPSKYAEEMSKLPLKTRVDVDKWLRRANELSAGAGQAQ